MQVLKAEIQKYPTRLEFRLALADVGSALAEVRPGDRRVHRAYLTRWTGNRHGGRSYMRLGQTYRLMQNYPQAIDAMQKARGNPAQ